jgi:hypothetical protein
MLMKKKITKEPNTDETLSQNDIENLLEQKEKETEALKHLISILGKMDARDKGPKGKK